MCVTNNPLSYRNISDSIFCLFDLDPLSVLETCLCIWESEMDVGLQTQVTRTLYKGVALVASAGTTNGAGRWWWYLWWGVSGAHLPGQMVGVCSGSCRRWCRAVGRTHWRCGSSRCPDPGVDGGVWWPRWGPLQRPTLAIKNLYIFFMLELCCYKISWCWCTKCMCGMLLSPTRGAYSCKLFPNCG